MIRMTAGQSVRITCLRLRWFQRRLTLFLPFVDFLMPPCWKAGAAGMHTPHFMTVLTLIRQEAIRCPPL